MATSCCSSEKKTKNGHSTAVDICENKNRTIKLNRLYAPLTKCEMRAVLDVLPTPPKGTGYFINSISLLEPLKSYALKVLEDEEIDPYSVERRAMIIALLPDGISKLYEGIILYKKEETNNNNESFINNSNTNTTAVLEEWKWIPNAQPGLTVEEYQICSKMLKTDERFITAMKNRGIDNLDEISINVWSPGRGYFGEEEDSRSDIRIGKPFLFHVVHDKSNKNSKLPEDLNYYAKPIHGIDPVIDITNKKIIRIDEYDWRDIPRAKCEYWEEEDPVGVKNEIPFKPLNITQPEGPSFVVNGHEVKWSNWQFVVGFNAREGITLHNVSFNDPLTGNLRPVLYRASISEMLVPYGDPTRPNYRKNAFDIGEEGIGINAHSLKFGCDCKGEIFYFDVHLAESDGIRTVENGICLHEEDFGVLMKHYDWHTDITMSQRSRRLAVSFFCSIDNYTYGFYWYFYMDGRIQSEVKLTGILNTDATVRNALFEDYGTIVDQDLYAPIHQHFFCARLDMSIDGNTNWLYEANIVKEPHHVLYNPQQNAFKAKLDLLHTEHEAQRDINEKTDRFWIVKNNNAKNKFGFPTGYRLMPGNSMHTHLDFESPVIRRGGFLKHQLWATPYQFNEKYPAGKYPTQASGGDGLELYTHGNRLLSGQDIVLWYNFGMTHVPRPEEYPIMPCAYVSFELVPDNFFHKNPQMIKSKRKSVYHHRSKL